VFTLEDLVHPPVRSSSSADVAVLSQRTISLEVLRPYDAPSSGNPLPGPQRPTRPSRGRFHSPMNTTLLRFTRSSRDIGSGPRHGLPHPLRSAFAVSHDLDGLRLPEPGDVFRSHTSLRFVFPAPHVLPIAASLALAVRRGPKTHPSSPGSLRLAGRTRRSVPISGGMLPVSARGMSCWDAMASRSNRASDGSSARDSQDRFERPVGRPESPR
jgi:hypothetical protein